MRPEKKPVSAASLVLVHGAGSGPEIFRVWIDEFSDLAVVAPDLHEGLDVSRASMQDYAQAVVRAVTSLPRPLYLCGWSMGGLVALMAADSIEPAGLILLEASPPAEVQGSDESVPLRTGTFDPEQVYGAFPVGVHSRPESQLARDERKRGISVPSLPCPCLVIWCEAFPEERGRRIADLYEAETLPIAGADHWDLVTNPEVRREVRNWLNRSLTISDP